MLIDTHAHLDMKPLSDNLDQVMENAYDAGVKNIISVGTDGSSSREAIKIASRYTCVYATCGLHPHDAKYFQRDEPLIRELLKSDKVCAVGEIGLDFHYDHSPRDCQMEVFARQLEIAGEADLPVVIHCRDAAKEMISILKQYPKTRGVVHCFSGDRDVAKWLLDRGFYISFTGTITFKNAASYLPVVESVPIESMMLETDSPFLAPIPKRGHKNEPAYLVHIARKLAEIKQLSYEDIERITTYNARQLFNLEGIEQEGKIVYPIRNSLYLNITNRCTAACGFCVRYYTDFVKGHNLRLESEPTAEMLIERIAEMHGYDEVVFCGYGEPFLKLDVIKTVAAAVKNFKHTFKVRIDTNGHGNIIHARNILPELAGLIDSISISLNAESEEVYFNICRPKFGHDTYGKVKEFVLEAKKHIPEVCVTVVRLPEVDIEKCRKIAQNELGVKLKIRECNQVG